MMIKLRDAYPEHETLDRSYDFVVPEEDDSCHLVIMSLMDDLTLDEFLEFYNRC